MHQLCNNYIKLHAPCINAVAVTSIDTAAHEGSPHNVFHSSIVIIPKSTQLVTVAELERKKISERERDFQTFLVVTISVLNPNNCL